MGDGNGMLSLSWNNHSSTFSSMLSSLRRLERYTDVTLSCDGEFYCVHKFVLSTCSDYFTKIFDRTPCKHPVIVLKDIKSKEMEALLNYMYVGQVSVAQDDLGALIKVAELLQIKGLAVPDEPFKAAWKGGPMKKWQKKSDGNKHSQDPSGRGPGGVGHGTGNEDGTKEGNAGMKGKDGSGDQGQENNIKVNNDVEMEENVKHAGLMRIGTSFHPKENADFTVEDLVGEDMELPDLASRITRPVVQIERINENKRNRDACDEAGGSCQYPRDGRNQLIDLDTGHPAVEERYNHGGPRPHHSQVEGSGCGGDTDGTALSLARYRYDKACQNRAAFLQNASQENASDGQPGPSLFYGMNEISITRDTDGATTVGGLHSFADEAFHNPYFLFSGSDPSESLSPKMRAHDKNKKKPYACEQCSYSTSSKSNLVIHNRTHTGERPYTCPECSFSASFEYNLKVHMRIHTGEKPFVCIHCPLRFAQKSHLKNHLYTHTGEKPFVCNYCSMRFSRRSNLRRHLAKHQMNAVSLKKEFTSAQQMH